MNITLNTVAFGILPTGKTNPFVPSGLDDVSLSEKMSHYQNTGADVLHMAAIGYGSLLSKLEQTEAPSEKLNEIMQKKEMLEFLSYSQGSASVDTKAMLGEKLCTCA